MRKWFFPSPVELEPIASLQKLRERLLNMLLLSSSAIGTVLLIISLIPAFQKGLSILTATYIVIYIWLLAITFIPRTPFSFRTGSMLIFLYVLGILNLLTSGLNVDSGLFFLAFIAMTALLIGLPSGLGALGLSVITVASIGTFVVTRKIDLVLRLSQEDRMLWIIGGTILLLMGTLLTISLTSLIRGLQVNLSKATALATKLDQEQVSLRQQAQNLERRSIQIRTAAEISRIITAVLEPQQLLQQVVDLLRERYDLYYAGVFLLDERNTYAVLNAGTGEAGKKMLTENHKLAVGDSSMIGWTIAHRQPRIALDVGQDAVRFANPHLPLTRSELALPFLSGDRVLGALTIQSEHEAAFDEEDIIALQGIADTLAIALENAHLFTELEENLKEIRTLHRQYLQTAWSERKDMASKAEYAFGEETPEADMAVFDIPLSLREQIIGQLTVEGDQTWTPEEKSLIEAIATQAALAMENARLLEESQQLALRERLASEIIGKIWASPNIDLILQTAVRELGRALRADRATIQLELDEKA